MKFLTPIILCVHCLVTNPSLAGPSVPNGIYSNNEGEFKTVSIAATDAGKGLLMYTFGGVPFLWSKTDEPGKFSITGIGDKDREVYFLFNPRDQVIVLHPPKGSKGSAVTLTRVQANVPESLAKSLEAFDGSMSSWKNPENPEPQKDKLQQHIAEARELILFLFEYEQEHGAFPVKLEDLFPEGGPMRAKYVGVDNRWKFLGMKSTVTEFQSKILFHSKDPVQGSIVYYVVGLGAKHLPTKEFELVIANEAKSEQDAAPNP